MHHLLRAATTYRVIYEFSLVIKMHKMPSNLLRRVAAVMPSKMKVVAIRKLTEAFGSEHVEWRFWLGKIVENPDLSSIV